MLNWILGACVLFVFTVFAGFAVVAAANAFQAISTGCGKGAGARWLLALTVALISGGDDGGLSAEKANYSVSRIGRPKLFWFLVLADVFFAVIGFVLAFAFARWSLLQLLT